MSAVFRLPLPLSRLRGSRAIFATPTRAYSVDAGPGGIVAGPSGLTVGRFAWLSL